MSLWEKWPACHIEMAVQNVAYAGSFIGANHAAGLMLES